MRSILLLLLLTVHFADAQEKHDPQSLAHLEMQAHQQQFSGFVDGTASSDNFDVKYYRLEWQIDPAVRYISGKVTVYYKMVGAGSSITLDLMSILTTDSVKQHGNLLTVSQPNNTLVINFPGSVNAGVLDSLSIWYKGIPANSGFGSFIQDSHAGIPVVWSLSEAYGARDWWPCKNGINDKADSIDVYITHPALYKAASNGLLQSETALPGNMTLTHWKHRYPISSYLICMAVTNYATFTQTVQLGNTTLSMLTYCYPENLATFQANTHNVLESMLLYNNTFGEYPFIKEKYGHVQFGWGGGMEHQTSTFVINTDEALMAHELGHQWFGDKITCASWEDIWLNEGFATFCAAYYMETKYPATTVINRQAIAANITSLPGGAVKVDDTTNLSHIFNQRLSYNKGSCLLRMLRLIMGDDVFFSALRRYQKDPALVYGNAHTSDLERNLEAESGRDLHYFFDQWYTGQGYPSYQIQWRPVGSGSVSIHVSQSSSHVSVPFFKLPVPLKFKNATQEKTVIVDNSFNGQDFIKTLGFVPDTVLVDPEFWLITKNNTTQKLPAVNTGAGIADIYPNPVTDPFTVYLHDFNAATADVAVFNKAGQQVYRQHIALTAGAELVSIPVSNWSHGSYTIKIMSADKVIMQQLLR